MTDKPNIILIITDQQRFDTINALGAPWMKTPVLDKLAREGAAFTNCYVTSPVCVGSRASLFTGMYPHATGVFTNRIDGALKAVRRLHVGGVHINETSSSRVDLMPYGG